MTDPRPSRPLHILAVDPFHGGSHREFLCGMAQRSQHHWTLVTGKPVQWKWRMRSAPLQLALAARQAIDRHGHPDVVFCSDMLDLPAWRGILRDPQILRTPTAIYFHENQWTYPVAPQARVDFHFGYTNLLSALTADVCWFNSHFHRRDFLAASEAFLRRMPDARDAHDLQRLASRCQVIPPGFPSCKPVDPTAARIATTDRQSSPALTLGWVSRWEHDKRPDRFRQLLSLLQQSGCDFRLILLGPRSDPACSELQQIREEFSPRIIYDGYAETRQQYTTQLAQMDIVVSTADHEFFGIAVCEAIWAGATPVLPNRLSYPELAPPDCLYESLPEAAELIQNLREVEIRQRIGSASREMIAPLHIDNCSKQLDAALTQLATDGESVPLPSLSANGDQPNG